MQKLDKYDIISLGNNKRYTIAEVVDYNEKKYLYLIAVDEAEELLDEYRIVKVVKDANDNYGVNDISDEKELAEVKAILLPLFELNNMQ